MTFMNVCVLFTGNTIPELSACGEGHLTALFVLQVELGDELVGSYVAV